MDFQNLRWLQLQPGSTDVGATGPSVLLLDIMNIYDVILRDSPYAAYSFIASTTSYANIMGGTSALSTTAQQHGVSMITGPSKPLIIGGTNAMNFLFPERFSKESNGLPFSLEAWIGMETTGAVDIMSHTGALDGLQFDGDYIYFGINIDGGGSIKAMWPTPDKTKVYHVVGTYTDSKISLYIDGLLKSEVDVPDGTVIAQYADKKMYGGTTASRVLKFEAPAAYNFQLNSEQVANHYRAGRTISPALDNVSRLGGTIYTLSDEQRDIRYSKSVDWISDGLGENVAISDVLTPNYDESDLSMDGTYTFSVPIADLDLPVTAQGMKVEWNGDGSATVEYSINDGTTWTVLVNGQIPSNTIGMSGTVTPLIRIKFAIGRAVGLDIVRDMRVTVYSSMMIYGKNGNERKITISGVVPTSSKWSEPIEDDDASGATIGPTTTNYLTLNESIEADRQDIATFEAWVKFDIIGNVYLIDSRSVVPSNASYIWISAGNLAWSGFSAVYVNGVVKTSGTSQIVADRLYHIVGVYTAAHNAKIKIGSAVSTGVNYVKMIGLYSSQLTAAQVSTLFKSYFGSPVLSAEDTNIITILETAPSSKAYVNDWAIQGAG